MNMLLYNTIWRLLTNHTSLAELMMGLLHIIHLSMGPVWEMAEDQGKFVDVLERTFLEVEVSYHSH